MRQLSESEVPPLLRKLFGIELDEREAESSHGDAASALTTQSSGARTLRLVDNTHLPAAYVAPTVPVPATAGAAVATAAGSVAPETHASTAF